MPENQEVLAEILESMHRGLAEDGEGLHLVLTTEKLVALYSEIRRLQAIDELLDLVRQAPARNGHPDAADDEALWQRILPRLERWADDRNRRDRAAFAARPRTW